jgi:polysaccharide deacetylase family protein (PEP-CTERM system associated)
LTVYTGADHYTLLPQRGLSGKTSHIFSVDVEEWFQVGAFEQTLLRQNWDGLESRVAQQTESILSLLAQKSVTATFFCLGWVAERAPDLIRKIAAAGHEIACHGMDHKRIYTMGTKEFSDDICQAKAILEDIVGKPVLGYRAPSFSMTKENWHFYEVMAEAGFTYSSSLYPAKTDHYGVPGAPRVPFHPIKGHGFIEIPMTVAQVGSMALPASGGGYFRVFPEFLAHYLMKRAVHQTGVGVVFYMHPWEVDPQQPRVKGAPLLSKFRHYTGQAGLMKKLERLFERDHFSSVEHWLDEQFERESI